MGRGRGHDDQSRGPRPAAPPATQPPDGVWTDAQILKGLADRLGAVAFQRDAREVFAELSRRATRRCRRLCRHQLRADRRRGRRVLALPGRTIRARRACSSTLRYRGWPRPLPPVEHRRPAEMPDGDFPYFLTTGRLMGQYQSGTQTRRVPELAAAEPEPFVEIHPATARDMGSRRRQGCG